MTRTGVKMMRLLAAAVLVLAACAPAAPPEDAAFVALQTRGQAAMGVDQYTSVHRFDSLDDGGRIELQRDPADTAGVAEIRRHLAGIRDAFARGDFSTPAVVHAGSVPGTGVMRARREHIAYTFTPLLGGGEVRLRTTDPQALEAIHRFMAFQRSDHRAGGHAGH